MAPITKATREFNMKQDQTAKITLYWLEKSRSQRVLWLLEEMKLDYELKTYKRQNRLAPADLKDVHPLGKSPIVTIESEASPNPLVLAESGFIFEYLIEHFGAWLAPQRYRDGQDGQAGGESEEWMRYKYYTHYAEGSLMPLLLIALLFSIMKSQSPFFVKPLVLILLGTVESKFLLPNLRTHFDFLESQLATSPNDGDYLCGAELSGADILMSFPLHGVRGEHGFTEENYPKLYAYVDRLEGLDGYKKAAQKVVELKGNYDLSL